MKGITPIIAIILLLLITVSMAGFAFVFLQRTLEQTAESTETGLTGQLNKQEQKFAIDGVNADGGIIYVRHTGSVNSSTDDVSVYINDVLQSCNWGGGKPAWAPNSPPKGCNVTTFTCPATIKITAPGNTDSTSC